MRSIATQTTVRSCSPSVIASRVSVAATEIGQEPSISATLDCFHTAAKSVEPRWEAADGPKGASSAATSFVITASTIFTAVVRTQGLRKGLLSPKLSLGYQEGTLVTIPDDTTVGAHFA